MLIAALAYATFLTSPAALPDANTENSDTVDALHPKLRSANAEALIVEDARPYMLARWRLKTQGTEPALRDLDRYATRLFPDRALLLRGQALEQRRDFEGAKRAYLDALQSSAAPSVSETAVRGLISVTEKLGDWKSHLEYIEMLMGRPSPDAGAALPTMTAGSAYISLAPKLDPYDPALALARASALLHRGRNLDAIDQIWNIIETSSDTRSVDAAEKLLAQIEKQRISKPDKIRIALARARHAVQFNRWGRALGALSEAKKLAVEPEATSIDIEIARVYRLRKSRDEAQNILQRIASRKDAGTLRADALLELGHVAMDRYQYPRARYIFQQVISEYPDTRQASVAAYDAAQVEYDSGDYSQAAQRMLAIEGGETSADLARNALWMAGWSAYLAGATSDAITNLDRLRNSDPDPELRDRATYWLARAHEKEEHWRPAIDAYREVALRSPFRYYGLWSRAHLKTLHVPWMLVPQKSDAPSTIEEAVALLGKDRPLNIDRAAALYKVNLVPEEVEELLAALEHYQRRRNRLGMTVVIDLFRLFDRDKWAEIVSRTIADESPEQPSDEPFFWRIWRYAYPTPFEPEVERAANDHVVDPFLTYAVMRTESRFRPDVVSGVGARGLMQLMPATARWIAKIEPDARREAAMYRAPGPNIWLGSWYLRNLVDRFGGNVVQVIGAYNAGPAAMDRWIERFGDLMLDEFAERVPYTETRGYIRHVLESYMIYHALYDRPPPRDEVVGRDG